MEITVLLFAVRGSYQGVWGLFAFVLLLQYH